MIDIFSFSRWLCLLLSISGFTVAQPSDRVLTNSASAQQGGVTDRSESSSRQDEAHEVMALGVRLGFNLPPEYCPVGKSERETVLLEKARDSMPPSVKLLQAAVLCTELKAYALGQRDYIEHWLQIQLLSPGGDFQTIDWPRDQFLQAVGAAMPEIDYSDLKQEAEKLFKRAGITVSDLQQTPLGRDDKAIYVAHHMQVEQTDSASLVRGLGAVTLINSLPLGIHVYSSVPLREDKEDLESTFRSLLNSLLQSN